MMETRPQSRRRRRGHDGQDALESAHSTAVGSSAWANGWVRAGTYAWAVLGFMALGSLLVVAADRLSIVAIPLVLAMFPAALLSPLSGWLKQRGFPAALAALVTLVMFLLVIAATFSLLAPLVAAEIPGLVSETQAGIDALEVLFDEGIFGWVPPVTLPEALAIAQDEGLALLQDQAGGIASMVAELVAGLLLGLIALFFYLKDGKRIAGWLRKLFPRSQQETAGEVGATVWTTLGHYFRGQLLVALVDAVFIGIGLAVLGVPLVLPLAVLVFFGGLFPIVGAYVTGAVVVLVALASQGFGIALAVLAVVVVVQQLESNILAPIVLGKATALHPLGVIVALTAGGILLGVLGAFLAVPVAASITKGVGIIRGKMHPPVVPSPASPG